MDYAEAIESLKTEKPDVAEAILGHVGSLKSENASSRIKAKENEGLASRLKSLSDYGLDIDADIGEQIKSLRGGVEKTEQEWAKRLSVVEVKLTESEKRASEKEAKLLQKSIESSFATEIDKNFYASKAVLKDFIERGFVGIDDEKPFVKVNEKIYGVSDGIPELRKMFPDYAKNIQHTGGGTSGAGGGHGSKTKTASEFSKLPPKEKAAFMADGGTII